MGQAPGRQGLVAPGWAAQASVPQRGLAAVAAADGFEDRFWSGGSLDELYAREGEQPSHPLAAVFGAAGALATGFDFDAGTVFAADFGAAALVSICGAAFTLATTFSGADFLAVAAA